MEKTLSEELDEMAEKLLNKKDAKTRKKDAKTRLKVSAKRFFSGLGFANALIAFAIIGIVAAVIILPISKHYCSKAKQSVAVSQVDTQEVNYSYNEKHWANVLILIHTRDVKRAAEIIKEADKPHQLLDTDIYNVYKNRAYMVTRELEELLKSQGVRYQRKEYDRVEEMNPLFHSVGAHIELYVETTPWINW